MKLSLTLNGGMQALLYKQKRLRTEPFPILADTVYHSIFVNFTNKAL